MGKETDVEPGEAYIQGIEEARGKRVMHDQNLSSFVTSRNKQLFELSTDRKDHLQNLIADEALQNRVGALKVVNNSV